MICGQRRIREASNQPELDTEYSCGDISLTRRQLLAGASAAGALAATSFGAEAGEKATVFGNYTQDELDHNYNQAAWAPNIAQILQRYHMRSEITRSRIGMPETFAYGTGETERLDVFRTNRPNAPVHIYVHGGAWREGTAAQHHFPAEMLTAAGAHYVAVDFSTVMDVGLDGMIDQLRRAVVWVYQNAFGFGGDVGRMYLSGHSSGAHLAGCLVTTNWSETVGLPQDVLKGAVLISGMYDLEPVLKSERGSYIPVTDEIEHAYSAMRHLDKLGCPVIVAYGGLETHEFQRHSCELAEAARARDMLDKLVVAEAYNHFEVLESFADPYGIIGYEALRQMKLTV
jgi:arylformamidase